jgi:hypothetical protein
MTARLASDIWVHALLRRAAVQGLFGAVLHKGHEKAGSVMVVVNHLDGTCSLLVPPPGPAYDAEGERRFMRHTATAQSWPDVREVIERARHNDSDIWVVEVEDRHGLAGLVPEQP